MVHRTDVLQKSVDEVWENVKDHEDLVVKLLIDYFQSKQTEALDEFVKLHYGNRKVLKGVA